MMGGNEKGRLTEVAGTIFTPDTFDGLKSWYRYVLQAKWQYVVFAVRRSYILALIMEIITGQKMEKSSSAIFLTDAALFLRCSELAEYYREKGRFPSILICDDALIHGRNINHIIEVMEEELCRLLCDDCEEEEIRSALAEAVKIHVYMRTEDRLLLFGRYGWSLHYIREERPIVMHQFASDVATLIASANITNAVYVYTEYLSDQMMQKVDLDGYISTKYQNTQQYSRCIYVGSDDGVKAILTLRLIKNVQCDGYRAAPFVFLPNLDTEETDVLSKQIIARIPEEDRGWIKALEKLRGKRSFNEIITLLLSNVILQEFNRANRIVPNKIDAKRELIKLSRNYAQFDFETTQEKLQRLLGKPLFTLSELEELLADVIPEQRIIMKLERGAAADEVPNPAVQRKIRENVEDYFYARGYVDEMSAYELINLPYFSTERRSKRRARGCGFTLGDLNQEYTVQESKYCMAYVQQMMDAGVVGISSYAPNKVRVIGFAQYAKAGEQSLLLEPLRWDIYIPMLARMQFECDRWRISLIEELKEYCTAYPKIYPLEVLEALVRFVRNLSKIGQTPYDWSGNYLDRIDLELASDKISTLSEYVQKQNDYREHYKVYAREKFY